MYRQALKTLPRWIGTLLVNPPRPNASSIEARSQDVANLTASPDDTTFTFTLIIIVVENLIPIIIENLARIVGVLRALIVGMPLVRIVGMVLASQWNAYDVLNRLLHKVDSHKVRIDISSGKALGPFTYSNMEGSELIMERIENAISGGAATGANRDGRDFHPRSFDKFKTGSNFPSSRGEGTYRAQLRLICNLSTPSV